MYLLFKKNGAGTSYYNESQLEDRSNGHKPNNKIYYTESRSPPVRHNKQVVDVM